MDTWHETVHPVHRDELFGQGVRHAVLLSPAAWNTADDFARLGDAPKHPGQLLTHNAPPVGAHADLQGWMSEDGWRPFDRVDLGHQSAVHQPGLVKDLISTCGRVRVCSILGAE